MPKNIVRACALLLAIGALPMPYGYYSILRLASFVVFVIAAYTARKRKATNLVWIYGVCALVFNPLIKVYLPKNVWLVLDFVAAGILLASIRILAGEGNADQVSRIE